MIGNNIIRFDTLDSTSNFVANSLMSGSYTDGDVILAQYQTNGRGQRDSKWQSLPFENLTISFAIPCDFLPLHEQFLLGKAILVGIHNYLLATLKIDVAIKWPNDVLVNDRKIAGMLIETKLVNQKRYAIVGLGLNINQMEFGPDLNATSLALELQHKVATANVANNVVLNVDKQLEALSKGNYDIVRMAYWKRLYGNNSWLSFKTASRTFTGKITDVDDSGLLLVRSKQGHARSYRAKEVQIIY
jgi:BirA family biotin operon repressor/biotin-[acetyl-CoA-carboxylase] ligase